nr:elongation factor 1-alpha-like isoform X2 [Ziziphus jujuba var. spinosa]
MGKEKLNINIVVIGHVGSGKSTTIGRLIYNFGLIDKHVIEKLKKEGAEMNQNSFNYVGVAERGRDISIDNGMWELETDKYHFTFIHAHGHAEFIKNMMTGASRADCALLVVDSTSTGGFEVDIFGNGRTPEHTLIKPLNVICCCNKMDATTPKYSKERYNEIENSISSYLKRVGYTVDIPFIPTCSSEGDNLIERSTKIDWYNGPTLLEALDQIREPERHSDKPLRLSLEDHDKIGRNGTIAIGRIVILNRPAGCLIPNGYRAMLHCHTLHGSVKFEEIISKSNLMSDTDDQDDQELKHTAQVRPQHLEKGDIGYVKMVLIKPMVVEAFEEYPPLGHFTIIDMEQIVGVGVITSVDKECGDGANKMAINSAVIKYGKRMVIGVADAFVEALMTVCVDQLLCSGSNDEEDNNEDNKGQNS